MSAAAAGSLPALREAPDSELICFADELVVLVDVDDRVAMICDRSTPNATRVAAIARIRRLRRIRPAYRAAG
jgi:hypothetical protein